jgi:hypothetical protein
VTWSLPPAEDGATRLVFRHGGFADDYPEPYFGRQAG